MYTARKGGKTGVENSTTASRPPGRTTRAISRSPAAVSCTLRSPKLMVAASKESSANGSAMASPATLGTSRPAPARSMPSEKSAATHHAPDFANSTVETAVPAARSRMRSPGRGASSERARRRHTWSMPPERTVLVRS